MRRYPFRSLCFSQGLSLAARVMFCLALTWGAGCATRRATEAPVFYPPVSAPGAPRIQYLTSFSTSADVEKGPSAFVRYLTGYKPKVRALVKPYGVELAGGKLFACDTIGDFICQINLVDRQFELVNPGGPGFLRKPLNMAVAADGTRYVVDSLRQQVMAYDSQWNHLSAIDQGTNSRPVDVAVQGDDLYICDVLLREVRVYDRSSGTLRRTVPDRSVTNVQERLHGPTNLAVDKDGNLYVVDTRAFRVQKYNAAGEYVRSYGRHGDWPGDFARPKGIALDRENRMYVADAAMQCVQIFDTETGRLLMYFGEGKSAKPLSLPAGVTVDYDHVADFKTYIAPGFEVEYLVIVASQYGPRRINVFGFGRSTGQATSTGE